MLRLTHLKVGMQLDAACRDFDFCDYARVEYVAHDWAVARTDVGIPIFINEHTHLRRYTDVPDQEAP